MYALCRGIKTRSFSLLFWRTPRQRNILSESLASPVGRTHQRVDLKLSGIMRSRPLLCPGRLRCDGPAETTEKLKRARGACYLFNNQNRRARGGGFPSYKLPELSESRRELNLRYKSTILLSAGRPISQNLSDVTRIRSLVLRIAKIAQASLSYTQLLYRFIALMIKLRLTCWELTSDFMHRQSYLYAMNIALPPTGRLYRWKRIVL